MGKENKWWDVLTPLDLVRRSKTCCEREKEINGDYCKVILTLIGVKKIEKERLWNTKKVCLLTRTQWIYSIRTLPLLSEMLFWVDRNTDGNSWQKYMFIWERKILVKAVGDELPRQRDVEQNLFESSTSPPQSSRCRPLQEASMRQCRWEITELWKWGESHSRLIDCQG